MCHDLGVGAAALQQPRSTGLNRRSSLRAWDAVFGSGRLTVRSNAVSLVRWAPSSSPVPGATLPPAWRDSPTSNSGLDPRRRLTMVKNDPTLIYYSVASESFTRT